MQAELSANEVWKLVNKAEASYETSTNAHIARRTRLKSIRNFTKAIRDIAPNKNITISIEDYLLLTQLPE